MMVREPQICIGLTLLTDFAIGLAEIVDESVRGWNIVGSGLVGTLGEDTCVM